MRAALLAASGGGRAGEGGEGGCVGTVVTCTITGVACRAYGYATPQTRPKMTAEIIFISVYREER